MKRIKILRNIFISVGVLFALVRLLSAGTNEGALNFGKIPLGQQPIITFDAPGAGTGHFEGTYALAINQGGTIAGYYFDSNPVTHGFVRAPDGTFVAPIDAPGGGTGPYQGTFVLGFNSGNAITGFVRDSSDVFHGYLRAPDGTFTTYDVPGAGTGQFQGTIPSDINATGEIAGYWVDPDNVNHGFVRDAGGTITPFDAPGAGTGSGQGTFVNTVDCLTDGRATVGDYIDSNGAYHGFVRAPDGTITEFDSPGAGTGPGQGTQPTGINEAGTIEAPYIDSSGVWHGAVRAADGTFTTFDVPGAGTGPGQGTIAGNINASGAITGWYNDSSDESWLPAHSRRYHHRHVRCPGCWHRSRSRYPTLLQQQSGRDHWVLP
jgi:hypothetical protein